MLDGSAVRGWDQLIVCGDLLFPGPAPLETWKLLLEQRAIVVRGLSDRALATLDPGSLSPRTDEEHARLTRLREVHREVGQLVVAHLGRLEDTANVTLEDGRKLMVVHGSPADPTEPLSFDMSDEEIAELLGPRPPAIVVCGGSHVPFDRVVDDTRVINVGSVGEAPEGRVAHATLLAVTPAEMLVDQFTVDLPNGAG